LSAAEIPAEEMPAEDQVNDAQVADDQGEGEEEAVTMLAMDGLDALAVASPFGLADDGGEPLVEDPAPVDFVMSQDETSTDWMDEGSVGSDEGVTTESVGDPALFDEVLSTGDWSNPPVLAYSTMNRNLTASATDAVRNRLTDWLARPHA